MLRTDREPSIAQAAAQAVFCPMEGAANGGAAHAPLLRNLGLGFLFKIDAQEDIPLGGGQLVVDDLADAPKLYLLGQADVGIFIKYISLR